MLKRACTDDLLFIEKLCSNSITGCKILCQVLSYGFERDFLEVWIMKESDAVTAVITRFYDDAALVACDDVDTEQLEAFFGMFSYNTLMLSQELARKLGFSNMIIKNGYVYAGDSIKTETETLTEDDFEAAYELISREIPGSFKKGKEAYLSFLSDFTFRQRRMMARGVCTHFDGKLASVAITSCETKNSAVISGVACDNSLRKTGLGKRTVLSVAAQLLDCGKTPYVIALNESAEGFYEHIGFIKKETIAFIERE